MFYKNIFVFQKNLYPIYVSLFPNISYFPKIYSVFRSSTTEFIVKVKL